MTGVLYASVMQKDSDHNSDVTGRENSCGCDSDEYLVKIKKLVLIALVVIPYLALAVLYVGVDSPAIRSGIISSTAVCELSNQTQICADQRLQKLDMQRNVYYDSSLLSRPQRYAALGQKGATFWFTGLSGSGKSTVGRALEKKLLQRRLHTYRLDGDNVRIGLNRDLGFSEIDRAESVRRVGEMAALFSEAGVITLVALVSPFRAHRNEVRELHKRMDIPFYEVFVDVPVSVAADRDVKGLYKRAMNGEIKDFTGISSPYEEPLNPEIHLHTSSQTLEDEVELILNKMETEGLLTGFESISKGYPGVAVVDGGNAMATCSKFYSDQPSVSHPDNYAELPRILLRDEDVHWLQIIGEGWAAPLRGFMREGVYLQSLHFSSVLYDSDNLTDGYLDIHKATNFSEYANGFVSKGHRVSMPVPIVLPINAAAKRRIGKFKQVVLVSTSGEELALLNDPEVYDHRKEERITRTFGAIDYGHPYIAEILKSGEYLLGGEIEMLTRIKYNDNLDMYRLTPSELRSRFEEMGADVVLAFQTRNPTHAGHAYLMNNALEQLISQGYKTPVLWLSPLGGWTKEDDVPLDVRVRQHEAILRDGMLDKTSTVLAIWPSPMTYAGPREVQWHAKSRKNAGASFFVVGRDPAGIKRSNGSNDDIYDGDHGRFVLHMAPGMENFNILSFSKVYYDVKDHKMKPLDNSRKQDFLSISGSLMRKMARDGLQKCLGDQIPSDWKSNPTCVPQGFMAKSGWDIMIEYYQNVNSPNWIPFASKISKPLLDTSRSLMLEGTFGRTDFKLYFKNETGEKISPWHDISLHEVDLIDHEVFNFIVEIPKGIAHKMEMNKEEHYNPIMQDTTHNGTRGRNYLYGVPFFNYGFFPQTWEDPSVKDANGNGGDNDPLDVIEVGVKQLPMGSVNPVKILGGIELIDQGEVDHKIIVLSVADEDAENINNVDDLQRVKPGMLDALVDWLKNYKIPEGKSENVFSQEAPISVDTAKLVVAKTHERWQKLKAGAISRDNDFWLM
ncbi:sulfate adenylyltransferase [Plasmopara halstedii]|uniref:Sulfate adenylyltransferase n=1 Tax=Plasmopara halstedii TaxID=4781 RepID=A0A0P1AT75_PLAHL|nr:sulfate adenylyltransferase [Plasmopara halstedii]CEG44432.1 sulfate adenylyltransferase [Plasmopara halstedii]|eukprot:XP_024580801.1 sulfate adenylyltransferase [Plasmopara halstedii]